MCCEQTLPDSDPEILTVVFAGGSTGGHLFPGLAVADELESRGVKCVFMGTGTPLEIRETEKRGFEFRRLHLARRRGGVCSAPVNLLQSARDVLGVLGYFKRRRTAAVVGLGAASMIGPVIAAAVAGIPRLLLEQNVLPGRATKFLCFAASEVITSCEETKNTLPKWGRPCFLGNPVRREVVGRSRGEAVEWFGFNAERQTVLVLGGSQGASSINTAFAESADIWAGNDLQIIHLAGENDKSEVEKKYAAAGVAAKVFSFCDNMGFAYAAADVIVTRAGGSAIAEITANGKPSVLVPYPYAVDGHQEINARHIESYGAAVVVREGEKFGSGLCRAVVDILRDEERISLMSSNSSRIGRRCAASDVASRIMELVPRDTGCQEC